MQDLEYLSCDLDGRSKNPVSILFDMLTHPDADIGIDETSLLDWKHHPEKAVPHVVLGKTGVGGAWQVTIMSTTCCMQTCAVEIFV